MAYSVNDIYDQTRRALDELLSVEREGLNPVLLLVIGGERAIYHDMR